MNSPNPKAVDSVLLQQCHDPHSSDCLSEMQSEDMRLLLIVHLDRIQQQVLELRCYGDSETAIAEQMQITFASVQRMRKSIAAVAKAINLTREDQPFKMQIHDKLLGVGRRETMLYENRKRQYGLLLM